MTELDSLLTNITDLRKRFTEANNEYEELSKTYKINEYFDSKEHAIYKFCATKLEESKNYQEILLNIIAITKNEFIDVIFIGRCSAGKSKIINAILMEKILPCAPSETTHCFVEISKSNDEKNYLRINKSKKTTFGFHELISEIESKISSCCGFNESIQIFLSPSNWQTEVTTGKQTKMIRLIDTPGYDNCKLSSNSNNNSVIRNITDRCKRCNIIVLVVIHDLVDKEREILDQLFEIPPELPILVLVNKWDLSGNESDEIANDSKLNIRNSFNNVRQTDLRNRRIYFVSALDEMKQISSQNSNERQEGFREFIAHLNQEINDQNISKFDKDISIIRTFYNETNKKYEESGQNLSNNIDYFMNQLDEIKKELENFQNKIRKKISKRKQMENKNFDSSKKSDLVDKLDKKFDLLENDLQSKLLLLYDFINENDPNCNQYLQDKQLFATGLDNSKKPKSIRKIFQWRFRDLFNNSNVVVATEATECPTQNEHFCEKLLQCTNSKLKIISDQIDIMLEFFPQYCEYLKNNKISSYFL